MIDCRVLICYMGAGPGDRVNADEPIAQIETDKVLCRNSMQMFLKDFDGYKQHLIFLISK